MATQTIAVLGASPIRSKFGNKCVRAYQQAGWQVYPVNLAGQEVEGLASYRTLAEVPGALDRIAVYLPPPVTRELLPAIAERQAANVIFNPGSADAAVLAEAAALGIPADDDCAIVRIGLLPSMFP